MTAATHTWSGGCQCGAVRYELLETPHNPHLCHCRMCQKQFGNYFAALATVPAGKFRLTRGALAHFQSSHDVRRGFCRDCGTPLTYEPLTRPNITIALGSLDRHSDIMPEVQYGVEGREPFFEQLAQLPSYPTGESETGATFHEWRDAITKSNRQHPDHDTASWPPATT